MSFDAERNSDMIIAELRKLADPAKAEQEKRYLKSELDFLGVTVPAVRKIVLITARKEHANRDELVRWVRAVWDDRLFERRLAAVELLRAERTMLTAEDLPLIEELIVRSAGWALVDPLAANIAGPIAQRDDQGWHTIDRWATDHNFWLRRSALLALLPDTTGNQDRFERYAIPMLPETEFFIRKAIGWVLREMSKKDPAYVTRFTQRHSSQMSGVTFREAVRRLPPEDKQRLTEARAN